MKPWHIRTQQEILDRIEDAVTRGDQGDEFNEYMRCAKFIPLVIRSVYEDTTPADWMDYENGENVVCDDVRDISQTGKGALSFLERAIKQTHKRRRGPRAARLITQYRAWKWLLGHEDAEYFDINRTSAEIHAVLRDQIITGKWDQMIGKAKGTK